MIRLIHTLWLSTAICFLLASSSAAQAQTGIKGRVTDPKGAALPGITLQLQGTGIAIPSDEKGNFQLENVPSGKYTILLSGIGFKSVQQKLDISPGKTILLNYTLYPTDEALQQVEIIGQKKVSYKSDYTFGATKTATYLKDIPQSVSIVTKELIADRQIERAWDVTKLMSGVNRYSNYNDIVIRGFRSGENQPRLINGMRAAFGYFDQPVTANLERIEVIKGPASALFGNAIPGGTINFVTKKPLPEKRYGLNFSRGSFNTSRISADVTGPITDSTLLFRMNAAYSNAESFRSLQGAENYMIAPSFSFLPSKRTSINIDMVYNQSNSKIDRGQPIFGATSQQDIYSTPISLAIGAPNDFYKVNNLQLSASLNHEFNDRLSLNVSYMAFSWDEKLLEHRTSNTFARDAAGAEIPTQVAMQVFDRLQKLHSDNASLFFRYKVSQGSIAHTLLAGYDYIQQIRPEGSTANVARGYRNAANTGVISTYDPAKKANYLLDAKGNPVPNVPHFDLQNVQYPIRNTSGYIFAATVYPPSKYLINALYVQDQVSFKKWQLLLGFRQEFYTDYSNNGQANELRQTQQAFIPRAGLIYTLTPQINLYGTYTAGYEPQSPATFSNPNAGGPFDPSRSAMWEAGAKGGFFNDRLAVNFALYQIKQSNALVTANDASNPDLLRQRKEQSRGLELELIGNLLPNLMVNANYAYNEATIIEGIPTEIGMQKGNAPKHAGNAWLRYSLSNGLLNGLGLGIGLNYSDRRNTEISTLQLPSFVTTDAAAYYTINKIRLALNVNNLFNEKYWIAGYNYTRIFPGEPRNMMFSLSKMF